MREETFHREDLADMLIALPRIGDHILLDVSNNDNVILDMNRIQNLHSILRSDVPYLIISWMNCNDEPVFMILWSRSVSDVHTNHFS